MAESKKHFLSEMLKTGIYGEKWPKATCLIVMITIEDVNRRVIFNKCYRSDHQDHAEIKMLKDKKI